MKKWLLIVVLPIFFAAQVGCGYQINSSGLTAGGLHTFNPALNKTSVFMGDSITALWALPVHNAGVSGDPTSTMVARFAAAVLGHGYVRVIILGGTNDVLNFQLPTSQIIANLDGMATTAKDAGIQPVMCLVPPIYATNKPDVNPQVQDLNQAISALARAKGYKVVDYNTPLLGHQEYFKDGIHPTVAGYAVMEDALARVVTN